MTDKTLGQVAADAWDKARTRRPVTEEECWEAAAQAVAEEVTWCAKCGSSRYCVTCGKGHEDDSPVT